MEKIESALNKQFESTGDEEVIDKLISEFPEELQDRLWDDVDAMDAYSARDYLVAKLLDRKVALLPPEYTEVPKFMEVITDNPVEVQESLERARTRGSEYIRGAGLNGEVISSTRQEDVCYKTLYLERAQELGANVAREALLQNAVFNLLQDTKFSHAVPRVDGFVKNEEVQAIKMEEIDGPSLLQNMEDPEQYPLPDNFDTDAFFSELEELVQTINDAGYFHRDLIGNAGNVLCNADGRPVLVDFGAAAKAYNYDPAEAGYQLVPNGQYYVKNDIAGVANLRKRFREFEQERLAA